MLKVYIWKEDIKRAYLGHTSIRVCNLLQNELRYSHQDLTYISFSGNDLFNTPSKFNTYDQDIKWHRENGNKIKHPLEINIDINELFYDQVYIFLQNGGYHRKYDLFGRNCSITVTNILNSAINNFWKYEFKDEKKYGFWRNREAMDILSREEKFKYYFFRYNNSLESYENQLNLLETSLYRANFHLKGIELDPPPVNIFNTWKPSDTLKFANFYKALVESNKNNEYNIYDFECLLNKIGATYYGLNWF
ncbi:MAG: hypothetical protein HC815_32570 [Richelia sp. RM1_1_1]|nr:hypothetical protein [Richelia sp. RM1_1_1]